MQVLGAAWYLMSIGRQHSCWRDECYAEQHRVPPCNFTFLDCNSLGQIQRAYWLNFTKVLSTCDANNLDSTFKFGMFSDAFTSEVAMSPMYQKYLYSLWWGLRNLRCIICFLFSFISSPHRNPWLNCFLSTLLSKNSPSFYIPKLYLNIFYMFC